MLTQTEIERERYESRLKAQMDHHSFLDEALSQVREARQEGREEEREEANRQAKIGVIQTYEQVLNVPLTPADQLANRPLDELSRLCEELQGRVLKQSPAK